MAYSRASMILGHCNMHNYSSEFVDGPIKEIEAWPTSSNTTAHFPESDDDVVIVSALRTPICKAKRGLFKVLE